MKGSGSEAAHVMHATLAGVVVLASKERGALSLAALAKEMETNRNYATLAGELLEDGGVPALLNSGKRNSSSQEHYILRREYGQEVCQVGGGGGGEGKEERGGAACAQYI